MKISIRFTFLRETRRDLIEVFITRNNRFKVEKEVGRNWFYNRVVNEWVIILLVQSQYVVLKEDKTNLWMGMIGRIR